MADVPSFSLGIPIADCNLSYPDAAGLPANVWTPGTAVASYIYGMHSNPFDGLQLAAAPHGTGRSLYVRIASTMDGSGGAGESYLLSGPTYYNQIPRPGSNMKIGLKLYTRLALLGSQSVEAELVEYNSAGSEVQATSLGTLTASDDTSQLWTRKNLSVTVTPINTNARYFRVRYWFTGDGGQSDGVFGLDWFGLGFRISTSGWDWQSTDEAPVAPFNYYPRGMLSVSRPSFGAQEYRFRDSHGLDLSYVATNWERIDETARNKLAFFWAAQRGTPTGNSDRYGVSWPSAQGQLGGHQWPTLIDWGRDDMKPCGYYWWDHDEAFPIGVGPELGYIKDPHAYSGPANFREATF